MGDLRINRPRFLRSRVARPPELTAADIAPGLGHNGGPPLDHVPEWGIGGIGNYFVWRTASEAAFKKVPVETAIRRARKAESLGLTYREYQLEILERGRFLQAEDAARIAEIIAARSRR
ncbi:MAG: hypothetical protein ACTHKD_11755 [Devosia sp.]|jgi:hypothetical protein